MNGLRLKINFIKSEFWKIAHLDMLVDIETVIGVKINLAISYDL